MKTDKPMSGEERYRRLLEAADSLDSQELRAAWDARLKAVQTSASELGPAVTAAKRAAIEDFEAVLERLESRYFPDERDNGADRFKNRKQAWDWLCAQGYKISRGKFYQDCDAGFPTVAKDGSVSKFSVLQYGQQVDVETRIGAGSLVDAAKKEYFELRKLELDVAERERKARAEDARWMLVEDGWSAVASVLGALREGLHHQLHEAAPKLVFLADGDPDRAPEVLGECEQVVVKAFNELGPELKGLFPQVEAGDE